MSKDNYQVPKLSIGTIPIKSVESKKFLGVTFDSKMSWKPHINTIITRLNSCLGATRRARPFLNKSALFNIYHSLMQSHTQYCCTTWAAWEPRGNQVILQRLQAVCNKFFRVIYNLGRMDSVRSILRYDQVLNISQLYDFNAAQFMHKAKKRELPIPLQKHFETDQDLYHYFFKVRTYRLKQSEKSIYEAGPRIWNGLPNSCILETNFSTFKVKVRQHLLTI